MNTNKVFLAFLFVISFQACKKGLPLNLSNVKTDKHVLVAEGVHMIIPKVYRAARSYSGYQVMDKSSSISVKPVLDSISSLRAHYTSDKFKRSNLKLLKMKAVHLEGVEEGLFCSYIDKRSKFISTNIWLPNKVGYLVQINILCHLSRKELYEDRIDDMMNSIYFDSNPTPLEEEPEPFQLVYDISEKDGKFFIDIDGMEDQQMYTRDGKSPTASEDSLYVFLKSSKVADFKDARTFFRKTRINGDSCKQILPMSIEQLSNATQYDKHYNCQSDYYRYAMICDDEDYVLIIAKSKNERSTNQAITYFLNQFVSQSAFGY